MPCSASARLPLLLAVLFDARLEDEIDRYGLSAGTIVSRQG
jgi:hypothetical protein